MAHPQFSIIIPVYNAENYLTKCIDSVLSQSIKDFELILIDDGSKDRSPQICDDYAKKDYRIKVIHKKNSGVSAARNDGLDIAKGEFITFVDSDDWVEPDYLYSLMKYTKYDIVFFSHRLIYEDGYSSEFKFQEKEGNNLNIWKIVAALKINTTKWNFYGFTWNKMFRHEIIQESKIRFVKGLRVSEDEIFTLDFCTHACSMKVLPLCLYNYRLLKTGLTSTKNMADEYEKLTDSYLDIIYRENKIDINNIYISYIISYLYTAAREYGNISSAIRCIKKINSLFSKYSDVNLKSKTMRIIATSPIVITLVWWFCIKSLKGIRKLIRKMI